MPEGELPFKVNYDPETDTAYLYIQPPDTRIARLVEAGDTEIGINLDALGQVIVIEFLRASTRLPESLLRATEDFSDSPPTL